MARIFKNPIKIAAMSAIFLALCMAGFSTPVKHTINIVSFTFNPGNISINAGDTVEWVNATGTNHNVNGSTSVYPGNAVSFGNNVGPSWTYSFVFTIVGAYNYRCDLHYTMGMVGLITVLPGSSIQDNPFDPKIISKIYPNPTTNSISFELSNDYDVTKDKLSLILYNTEGSEVIDIPEIKSHTLVINREGLQPGVYFYVLRNKIIIIKSGKVVFE
jgi:plastocyanin